jgi:hypothetical protein
VGDARQRAIPRRLRAVEVPFGIAVGAARDEHDVARAEPRRQRGVQLLILPPQRAAAFRPRERVATVVGIREGVHHAEPRPPFVDQPDGDRAAAAPEEVITGAVVRVHQPDGRSRAAFARARLLAEIAPRRLEGLEARADQPLGLQVRVRLVAQAAGPARTMEVEPQHIARLARRGDGDRERAAQVVCGRNSGQVRTGWAGYRRKTGQ